MPYPCEVLPVPKSILDSAIGGSPIACNFSFSRRDRWPEPAKRYFSQGFLSPMAVLDSLRRIPTRERKIGVHYQGAVKIRGTGTAIFEVAGLLLVQDTILIVPAKALPEEVAWRVGSKEAVPGLSLPYVLSIAWMPDAPRCHYSASDADGANFLRIVGYFGRQPQTLREGAA